MIRFIQSMGPSGPIMVVISIVIIVLAITKAVQVFGRRSTERVKLERGLDAILFWGVFCAILGLHGQTLGMYKGFSAVARYGAIDPSKVFLGLAECLSSTVMGLTILMLSALIWFSLRAAVRRLLSEAS
jgi:biopolymer transport protein ExbB/TolQ